MSTPDNSSPKHINADDLDDRQLRAVARATAADKSNGQTVLLNESTTLWMSKQGNRAWTVTREEGNHRGKLRLEYSCTCGDFGKNGRIDCEHIFAERLRRGEVIIDGQIDRKRADHAKSGRRPPRKRIAPTGQPMRSVQREARVTLPERIPELIRDLKRVTDRQNLATTRRDKHATSRAAALVFKIAAGKSADEMLADYRRLIETGVLALRKVPHQNTLSRWTNDPRLTPILQQMLRTTSKPFRAIECGGIIDSSKMSQMRSAHSRYVEYGDDQREQADWMKVNALVGVETLVCMGAIVSGTRGKGTHDINYLLPLVESVQGIFNLRFVLADKAYLSENVVGQLWQMGMQAVIPIKKEWNGLKMKAHYAAYQHLVQWYDKRQAEFHEYYRLRPKIEAFFSLVKRVADGYCWSRGRPPKNGTAHSSLNRDEPCTAWVNETLCKLIYVNLRITVQYEIANGYEINYFTDTFFPPIPDQDKIVA